MKWKQWKVGLLIAIGMGIFQTMAGFAMGILWKQLLGMLIINIGANGVLYLKQHPEDSINFDTTIITKSTVTQSTVKTPSATVADGTSPTQSNEKTNP